jgi:hypothetical protein
MCAKAILAVWMFRDSRHGRDGRGTRDASPPLAHTPIVFTPQSTKIVSPVTPRLRSLTR